jgi:hypothetical protein
MAAAMNATATICPDSSLDNTVTGPVTIQH